MKKANFQPKNQMKEKITIEDKPEKPSDFEEVGEKLFAKDMIDYEVISLGENRGQFFVRLPTRMTNKLEFKRGDKIRITLILHDDERKLVLEAAQ